MVRERGAVVEWLEWLGYGAESRRKVAGSRLGLAIVLRGLENSFCQTGSKWVPFFELGKDEAAKGEGWASPFICSAQDTVAH